MAKRNNVCIVVLGALILSAIVLFFVGCRSVMKSETSVQTKITKTITQIFSTTETLTEPTTQAISTTVQPTTQLMYLDMGKFKLTAYCPCYECSGKWGNMTATGVKAKEGRTIAVDEDVIPYGYEVIIGGQTYRAEDCGGKVIGKHIDVYFNNHDDAEKFGIQYADVLLKVGKGE